MISKLIDFISIFRVEAMFHLLVLLHFSQASRKKIRKELLAEQRGSGASENEPWAGLRLGGPWGDSLLTKLWTELETRTGMMMISMTSKCVKLVHVCKCIVILILIPFSTTSKCQYMSIVSEWNFSGEFLKIYICIFCIISNLGKNIYFINKR